MEKNFIRVRSTKDIIVSTTLAIIGSVLIALPTSTSINILGFFLIFSGVLLGIFMKSGYKDETSGIKFSKKELYFDKSKQVELSKALPVKLNASDIKVNNEGNGIRLDIYHNKTVGKGYVQLFEYVPYSYEPCTGMYEHSYESLSEILK